MSDFDSLQFPLQLSHVKLLLFDPVQDLLLRPRDLFLNTQVNTRQSVLLAEYEEVAVNTTK